MALLKASMLGILVALLCTAVARGMLSQVDGAEGEETAPSLQLEIVSPRDVLIGVGGYLKVELRNVSDRELLVIRPVDGSQGTRRYPRVRAVVTGSNATEDGWCGNLNRLTADDFRKLAPGESLTMYLWISTYLSEAGECPVTAEYDSRPSSDEQFVPNGVGYVKPMDPETAAKLRDLLSAVERVRISATATVHTHVPDPAIVQELMIGAAPLIYRMGKRIDVIRDRFATGIWRVDSIRTFRGSLLFEFVRNDPAEDQDMPGLPAGLWAIRGACSDPGGCRLEAPLRSMPFHLLPPREAAVLAEREAEARSKAPAPRGGGDHR